MKYQVVITARAGSQRLAHKNMALLGKRPLIDYSIEFALKNFSKENVWVNSDDGEVLNYSTSKGLNILERPHRLATAHTPSVDVLKFQATHFIENNIPCDAIILLQPTSPFRDELSLREILKKFNKINRQSLVTFSELKEKVGRIEKQIFIPTNYSPGQRSQDLEKNYFENGLLYITKIESIKKGKIVTDDVYPLVCHEVESTVDIDYPEDLVYAESILLFKNEKK